MKSDSYGILFKFADLLTPNISYFNSTKSLYYNTIVNCYYLRESAFTAHFFIICSQLLNNDSYLKIALSLLEGITNSLDSNILDALAEPKWTPRGVIYKRGSIPASILLWDSLNQCDSLLSSQYALSLNSILDPFIDKCRISNGAYSHDSFTSSKKPPIVLNTTAMIAFYFANKRFFNGSDMCITTLINGCRPDGLFPYIYPSIFQQLVFSFNFHVYDNELIKKAFKFVFADQSIFFGDFAHHVGSLVYILRAVDSGVSLSCSLRRSILKAFDFTTNFLFHSEHSISFNFSWEPRLLEPRYCNFSDTSAYFNLLVCLNLLLKHSLISNSRYKLFTTGLLSHINSSLFSSQGGLHLLSHECDENLYSKIFPRPAESPADKAYMFSLFLKYNHFL